jgi:hypothetical protein
MARGKRGGAVRGRGRGGAGAGGAGAGAASASMGHRKVAKPAVRELPADLTIRPSNHLLPAIFAEVFPEFTKQQCFFSALERLCPELGLTAAGYTQCWMGVSGETIQSIVRDEESPFQCTLIRTGGEAANVFVKRIHILDALAALEGDYVMPEDGALPAPSEPWREALTKINDPLNEAYVDALFAAVASRLVESGRSPHWLRSFGTFSARADKYMYNITDEYPSFKSKPWWRRNLHNGLFGLHIPDEDGENTAAAAAHMPARKVFADEGREIDADDFSSIDSDDEHHITAGEIESDVDGSEPEKEHTPEPVRLSVPKLRLKRIERREDESSEEDTDTDTDDEDEESEVYAVFKNFPVQVTLLEHAEGTMDELLDAEEDEDTNTTTKEERWAAWLFQVIAALTSAQYWFGFVHNDLHTNNVMWTTTDKPHIYYRIHRGRESWIMKVPTFGKIMKIIDFGRASFHLPEPAGFFISDAFYPGNDAGSQYNCEPFYDPDDGKRVEPNPSFDLCRLSVSLIESLYTERPEAVKPVKIMSKEGAKLYTETVSPVYNLLWEWLIDDDGKNVLRKADGDERYPDFDLYRALAADVHRAVPAAQIEKPIFAAYRSSAAPAAGEPVYDLHI